MLSTWPVQQTTTKGTWKRQVALAYRTVRTGRANPKRHTAFPTAYPRTNNGYHTPSVQLVATYRSLCMYLPFGKCLHSLISPVHLHIFDRVDGNARHADIPGHTRVVGIVASVRRQIKRHAKALLPCNKNNNKKHATTPRKRKSDHHLSKQKTASRYRLQIVNPLIRYNIS